MSFFFNDPATTENYTYLHTLSLHDALPISCIDALLRGYENAGGAEIVRSDLEWQVAVAVLVRAKISSLRKLRSGWPRHFELMRSEEHTSELQSLMRISYAVFCLKKTT